MSVTTEADTIVKQVVNYNRDRLIAIQERPKLDFEEFNETLTRICIDCQSIQLAVARGTSISQEAKSSLNFFFDLAARIFLQKLNELLLLLKDNQYSDDFGKINFLVDRIKHTLDYSYETLIPLADFQTIFLYPFLIIDQYRNGLAYYLRKSLYITEVEYTILGIDVQLDIIKTQFREKIYEAFTRTNKTRKEQLSGEYQILHPLYDNFCTVSFDLVRFAHYGNFAVAITEFLRFLGIEENLSNLSSIPQADPNWRPGQPLDFLTQEFTAAIFSKPKGMNSAFVQNSEGVRVALDFHNGKVMLSISLPTHFFLPEPTILQSKLFAAKLQGRDAEAQELSQKLRTKYPL